MAGRHPIWKRSLPGRSSDHGNELPPRLKASTGAKAVVAGFGPHGVAVTNRTAAGTTRVVCVASAASGGASALAPRSAAQFGDGQRLSAHVGTG